MCHRSSYLRFVHPGSPIYDVNMAGLHCGVSMMASFASLARSLGRPPGSVAATTHVIVCSIGPTASLACPADHSTNGKAHLNSDPRVRSVPELCSIDANNDAIRRLLSITQAEWSRRSSHVVHLCYGSPQSRYTRSNHCKTRLCTGHIL